MTILLNFLYNSGIKLQKSGLQSLMKIISCGRFAAFLLFIAYSLSLFASQERVTTSTYLKDYGDKCYQAEQLVQALEKYTEALDISKKENNDSMQSVCLNCIGNIYSRANDYKRALHFYLNGYEVAKKINDRQTQYKFVSNIVAAYCMLGDVEKAKEYFNLQTRLPLEDVGIRRYYFLNNQALIAKAADNRTVAEYYYNACLQYTIEKGMPTIYKLVPYIALGDLQLKFGDKKKALDYYIQALDSASKAKLGDPLKWVYKQMSEAYSGLGQTDSAAKYKAIYLAHSDSMFNLSQFNTVNNKLLDYEDAENKHHIDSLTNQKYTLIAVIVVFTVLLAALAVLYIALRKKNQTLIEAQRMLLRKNEDISHYEVQTNKLLKQYVSAIDNQSQTDIADTDDAKNKRTGIGLNTEQASRLLEQINSVMDDISVISKPDFSLIKLSEMVGSNTRYVSWVINDAYGKNFKILRNERRIREACKRLSDHENYGNLTIQAIYEDLGFGSASSFIQAFKNVCGMTPSEYQKLSEQKDNSIN